MTVTLLGGGGTPSAPGTLQDSASAPTGGVGTGSAPTGFHASGSTPIDDIGTASVSTGRTELKIAAPSASVGMNMRSRCFPTLGQCNDHRLNTENIPPDADEGVAPSRVR